MRQRLAAADGYTLIELLVVMAILGVILAGVANMLVSGQRAEKASKVASTVRELEPEPEIAALPAQEDDDLPALRIAGS